MKLKSSLKITKQYNIDEILGDKCLTTFIDLSSEKVIDVKDEEGKKVGKEYTYNAYQIELMNNEEYIANNYDTLLNLAKDYEYAKVASEVRERRRKLLEETDCECLADRTPSQEMIDYRQALRDIPEQKGFPYDVVFPTKPIC